MSEEERSPNTLREVEKSAHGRVIEILGHLQVSGADLAQDGANNNTRWVFDIEVQGKGSLSVKLLDLRGHPARTDIDPSFHITAMDRPAAKGLVWGEVYETGSSDVRIDLLYETEETARYRVDIDIIGSNRR